MPKTQNKSDFIRSQPATMTISEVIAKGKANGMEISSSLASMVRSRAGTKAKKSASKKTANGATAAKPAKSKADFVRSLPKDMPVKEVVEKAKSAGVKLTVNYVYNVRASGKTAAKKKREARKATSKPAASVNGGSPRIATATSSAEDLLKAVAAEIGLGRAFEILQGERARVRAVIGG